MGRPFSRKKRRTLKVSATERTHELWAALGELDPVRGELDLGEYMHAILEAVMYRTLRTLEREHGKEAAQRLWREAVERYRSGCKARGRVRPEFDGVKKTQSFE